MTQTTISLRLDTALRDDLVTAAAAEGVTMTSLVERFVREGLATTAHPGIVFRGGRSGRRAGLAGGPDVWEIAAALRRTTGTETQRVATLTQEFGIHQRQVMIALDYAAANREEIDSRVNANDRALDEVGTRAAERARLFG